MHRHLHNLLLLLVTLSLALAPLRGAWALPEAVTPDPGSHCTGMQHDMQQTGQHAGHGGNTGGDTDSTPHNCKFGCNGSCCDQDCATCLHHGTAAIPANLFLLHDAPVQLCGPAAADNFPQRHLKPPLRPPLTFHS